MCKDVEARLGKISLNYTINALISLYLPYDFILPVLYISYYSYFIPHLEYCGKTMTSLLVISLHSLSDKKLRK